jgi:hypothetical protein
VRGEASFVHHYSHASLRLVAQFVPRPRLHDQIKQQPHDVQDEATDTRILVASGPGGSGKSQLVLNYVREHRIDYKAIFWVEAGQKESIERDFQQIYLQLFDQPLTGAQEPLKIEDVVPAVKSWFHTQTRRSLMVFDSADGIDENDSAEPYIDIIFYLPDASLVDIVITTRCARAARITDLEVVEVGEMGPEEAVALFHKHAQLRCEGSDVDGEVSRIADELGFLALAIALAGSYVGAMPRLRSNVYLYLPEYRAQRRTLLDVKAKKYIPRYGESVQEMGRWVELHEIKSFLFRMTGTLLGEEHPDALASMNDLANVLSRQGKYRQVEEMHRQALRLRETVLGVEHPHTLSSIDNLATVLWNQGKYEEAVQATVGR